MFERRFLFGPAILALAPIALACASGLPALVSATPDEVTIEYAREEGLKNASKLAREECEKLGRTANFEKVTPAVGTDSNVAHYACVPADVAAGAEN